jgi:RNA polymerase sigma-70 factor (sigma-E family)
VSTTVVENQSTEAARGSPAADPIPGSPPTIILAAPTDESSDGTAVAEVDVGPMVSEVDVGPVVSEIDVGTPVSEVDVGTAVPESGVGTAVSESLVGSAVPEVDVGLGLLGEGAAEAATPDVAANGSKIASNGSKPEEAQGSGTTDAAGRNGGNLGADGEPPAPDGRPTDVTATLSESDLLLGDAPAEAALAPDTFATSAFDAEGARTPAVWDASDVVTEIYHGHYNQLVRLAVLLVHDVQTAEEVVQDAFEAMHLAWRRLRDSEKALQYLRQTVVNRSRSVLRHRKVVDMHAPKPAPDEPSAEHAALALLERSAVAAALRSLPERQREAIALRYYADFSEADIAKAMGISKGAVKSHTARAMSSLKTILSQETP